MSFPNKSERTVCWDSRDKYWECLEQNQTNPDQPDPPACKVARQLYESSCPSQWVKHFDRKRSYNIFKKKIETEGYEPLPASANAASTMLTMGSSRKQKPFKRETMVGGAIH